MQISDFIIAEWSHNGKCRIWKNTEGSKYEVPKLYNTLIPYDAMELRMGASFEQTHHASEHGTWQNKVEYFIRQHTNIKISFSEYMP